MAKPGCDPGGKRGRYYDPPTAIPAVDGLRHRRLSDWADEYLGTAEALEAAGIVAREAMPGAPGMPTGSVAYRPRGLLHKDDSSWHRQPGFMLVYRKLDGLYRVVLNISAEERARRERITKAREEELRQAEEDAVAALMPRPGTVARALMDAPRSHQYDVRWGLKRADYRAAHNIDDHLRHLLEEGLKLIDRIEEIQGVERQRLKLEWSLEASPMVESLRVIAQASTR